MPCRPSDSAGVDRASARPSCMPTKPTITTAAAAPPHPASYRPARHREQRQARAAQVGGGAHAGLVRPVPAPGRPLRATRRHPPRLPDPRRSPHHLALRPTMVLLGALSRIAPKAAAGADSFDPENSVIKTVRGDGIPRSLPAPRGCAPKSCRTRPCRAPALRRSRWRRPGPRAGRRRIPTEPPDRLALRPLWPAPAARGRDRRTAPSSGGRLAPARRSARQAMRSRRQPSRARSSWFLHGCSGASARDASTAIGRSTTRRRTPIR